ncbi:MAG TPA: shikimate dehydrogenase [Xanthobacteraceae bacterium]|nr:shikimate dehydrogenase [Xanthobacteraceae bacterium]HQS49449.1 shikimate dehydrogenase [Xanthobacteraceae bacterium]
MTQITGYTRLFGILADPIQQVKTPQALNALMARVGYDGVLVPLHARAEDLAAVVGGLKLLRNLGGLIVTVPHKTAMVDLCDEVSESARLIGAVNTIRRATDGRLVGEMLDGHGFVAGLRQNGIEPEGRSAYLAGAGGAANAIAFALAQAGISRLTIANRTRAKAEDLAGRLAGPFPNLQVDIGTPDPSGHDLVVNATSLGLKEGDPLPLDVACLSADQIVAEIIMQPVTTALLAAAQARGCRIQPGQPMLDCQLALMAKFVGMEP